MKFKVPAKVIWGFVCVAVLILLYKLVDNFGYVTSFIGNVCGILKPFFIGFIIAYILNMPCKKLSAMLEKSRFAFVKRKARGISIAVIYVVFALLIVMCFRLLVPALYRNIMDLYINFPSYARMVNEYIEKIQLNEKIALLNIDPNEIFNKVYKFISEIDMSKFGEYAKGVINVTSGVVDAFLAIIISIYMLIDKDDIKNALKKMMNVFFNEKTVTSVSEGMRDFNKILAKYLACQLMDAAIVALLSILSLSVIRVKYALVLGLLIGICNLIPYFGAIIAIAATILVVFFTGGALKAVIALAVLIVMQQIDANVIGPRIMGSSLDLRPIMVIFAVTLGGGLFGIPGMILSIPVFTMIKKLSVRYMNKRAVMQGKDKLFDEDDV